MLQIYRAFVRIGAVLGSAARGYGNGGMVKRRNAVGLCTVLISVVRLILRILIVRVPYTRRAPGIRGVPVLMIIPYRKKPIDRVYC